MLLRFAFVFACFISQYTCLAQPATVAPAGSISFTAPSYETSFVWESGLTGNRRDKHTALLIPVTLPSSRRVVYMQLDTGSPVSMLYSDQLYRVLKADTNQPINELTLQLGGQPIVLKKPKLIKQGGGGDAASTAPLIIGTFGTDFLSQHVVQLDFPKKKLTMMDTVPASITRQVVWSPLLYERGNILLPARIRGKASLLYWDTGSSSFGLLTDRATWASMAAVGAVPDKYTVQSWGKPLTAHTVATPDSIQLGKRTVPIGYVSYIEGASDSQINRMMALGIGGMTGNQLFLQSTLLLDTRNRRYGFLDN